MLTKHIMKNRQAILLLSGGIDSTTLLAKLIDDGHEVIAISYDYGQKHGIEINYAKENCKKYGVKEHHIITLDNALFSSSALVNKTLTIGTFDPDKTTKGKVNAYVPFRNLLFISNSLSLAETMNINEIYLAFNNDDSSNFWDCTKEFVEKINLVSSINSDIQVKAPFINLSKRQIVQLAMELGVDLNKTITCYQPESNQECGVCLSCITKQKAMEND